MTQTHGVQNDFLCETPRTDNDNSVCEYLSAGTSVTLSEQELVHLILRAVANGATYTQIRMKFICSEDMITQARSLSRLHTKLMLAFIKMKINLTQAAAFCTLPNPQAQLNLLSDLGSFVNDPDVISAVASGKTVIKLPDGDVIILPSRKPVFRSSVLKIVAGRAVEAA